MEKYQHGAFNRNLLDDLRLGLEKLLCALLQNEKSLEMCIRDRGRQAGVRIHRRGGS